MKLKIQKKYTGDTKVTAALAEMNGKTRTHTASETDIINVANDAEKQLADFGIAKKDRAGAQFIYMSGGSVAKLYKYCRTVNIITAVRGAKEWFIHDLRKAEIWPDQSGSLKIGLTAEQERIALSQIRSKFFVTSL